MAKIIHTTWRQKFIGNVVPMPIVTVLNLRAPRNHYWITDSIHGPRETSRYKLFKHYERTPNHKQGVVNASTNA